MKISTILIVSKTCKNRLADPNESNIFMSLEALLTVRGSLPLASTRHFFTEIYTGPNYTNLSVEFPAGFSWKPLTTASIEKGILRKHHFY